ncbi:MAG: hypothetical protein ROZ37_04165 [Aromatoleum sp.]|uniref:hypothetical protein n=1 Tax=Aromatoleum sp. TaxID=2307007 RepID=UPI0028951C39|nr:hypothetical protein [Aromatoleum sp.]MDT3669514.1 hypothetical protein [Aromatoleum sp.]
MHRPPHLDALYDNLNRNAGKPMGPLQKFGAAVVAVIVFGVSLAFSVMFFAVVAAIALVIGAYVWWKTRDLRKAMRQAQAQAHQRGPQRQSGSGIVIEGEVLREVRDDPNRG